MNNIRNICFYEIVRPLRITFSTSLGQKDVMKSVIIKVVLKDGSCGMGECPTNFMLKGETVPAIKGILKEISPKLINMPIDAYEEKTELLRRKYSANPMTVSGLEVALFRAYLKSKGLSEHHYWGSKNTQLETDITIPFITDSALLEKWIKYAIGHGFAIFKLKVSGDVEQDIKLMSMVHRMLKEKMGRFTLRLDGNQGYTEKTFRQMSTFIMKQGYSVELFEQPLPKADYKGLKEIRKHSPIPIILDETIFTCEDLRHAIENALCDGINIKIAKSGMAESRRIFETARKYGLKLMIGCMTEAMIGLSAGIYFASGTGGFDYIDLDSIYLLYHKNHYNGITIKGPVFTIT